MQDFTTPFGTRAEFSACVPIYAPKAATWAEIIALCPALVGILDEARSLRRGSKRRRRESYEPFKQRITALVGWHARDERLGTSECYEAAMIRLVKALGV